jgi:hypothetical protein
MIFRRLNLQTEIGVELEMARIGHPSVLFNLASRNLAWNSDGPAGTPETISCIEGVIINY